MAGRDDENLEMISGLSAERDDDLYPGAAARAKKSRPAPPPRARQAPAPVPARRGAGLLPWLAIVALAGVIGWLGFEFKLSKDELAATSASLEQVRNRLDELGFKLSATDSSFSETGNVIDERFKFFDSEIRKLWDVSNKRNKKLIDDNTAEIAKLSEEVKSATQRMTAVAESASKVEQQLRQISSDVAASRGSAQQQSEQLLVMRGELEVLQSRITNIPNNMGTRLEANEEAIEAIDAARRQMITRLTELQERVNQLQLSMPAGSP